ncbi:MAG TPA: hypothetical protein VHW25_04800 [Steroidobacteraceae bacterium]|jgi:hypothetical protein|nr:hypothetical protein [Steroidobacteraceae bacterium]
MNASADLDSRLDEALEESFPASDPPAVHSIDPKIDRDEEKPGPQSTAADAKHP